MARHQVRAAGKNFPVAGQRDFSRPPGCSVERHGLACPFVVGDRPRPRIYGQTPIKEPEVAAAIEARWAGAPLLACSHRKCSGDAGSLLQTDAGGALVPLEAGTPEAVAWRRRTS